MTKKNIKLTQMSPSDTKDLFSFLSRQPAHTQLWKANQEYQFGNDKFTFSHDIVWRKRNEHKSGNRYEVISPKELGKGAFGTVYDVTGTLALDSHNITFKQNKQRVVKVQTHSANNPLNLLKNEYNLAIKASNMHIKEPTLINNTQSYTVMKKLPGKELWDVIKDNLVGKSILTLEQRTRLSIAILKAYKEQVLNKGIIHRDIKPPNIMVDLKDPITVNFIDFGLSTLTNLPNDGMMGGTPGFMAPEIYDGVKATPQSDIFSIARVLGVLWRDNLVHYTHPLQHQARQFANNVTYNDLFTGLPKLNGHNRNIIKTTLTNMSKKIANQRISVDEAITAFESTLLTNHMPHPNPEPKTQPSPINNNNIQEQVTNILNILEALRLKNLDLRNRGYKDLGREYSVLAEVIEQKTKQFQVMQPEVRQKNIATYLKECDELIAPVKGKMADNRDSNYLWANLALAIAGLGVFYLIAISCNKASTGNWLFFSKPKSLELAENLEEGLQRVAAAAAA